MHRFYLLFSLTVTASLAVGIFVFWSSYKTAEEEVKEKLLTLVVNRKVMVTEISEFDLLYNRDHPGGPRQATLLKLKKTQEMMKSFGDTGEFAIAEKTNDSINFIFHQRHSDFSSPSSFSLSSSNAEPMRLALEGKTGTIIAKDYLGHLVIAAYTPVPSMGLGLVEKIDAYEVHKPFITSGITSFFISILILSGTALVFFRLATPISNRIIKSEESYRDLYDNAPDMFATVDPKTAKIVQCNQTLARNLGYEKSELIGLPILSIYNSGSRETSKRYFKEFKETGRVINAELKLRHRNGNNLHVMLNIAAVYDPQGEVILGRYVWRDISERRAAEEQQKLAASVFTAASEGIIITDNKGKILDINRAFETITGYQHSDAIGKNPNILKSGRQSEKFYQSMWKSLINTGNWHGEIWNKRKNGSIYPQILTINTVNDDEGNVKNYIATFFDITQIKENENKLKHLAQYDALTNLPNRVLLADRLKQAMLQAQRKSKSLVVAYIDLDGFKLVNDLYGHDIGDKLLIEVAKRMKKTLREIDTLARIGGDEFIAVLSDLDNSTEALPVLNRLLDIISERIQINNLDLAISASIGATVFPQQASIDPDQLQRQADQAMYDAKLEGKNCCRFFDPEHNEIRKRHYKHLTAIEKAIENDEFLLYYQPKTNMRTGKIIGLEALIRWQHPTLGLLFPNEFLPQIEGHDISVNLGDWVINNALKQLKEWQQQGIEIPISINVGAEQLQQADFVEKLKDKLSKFPDLKSGMLEMEILETSALQDLIRVSGVIEACNQLGVEFALDDFGTGYSSLVYLKSLPIKTLKIDQSFIRNILEFPQDHVIMEGVISLANSFNLNVIAEGVETIDHGRVLLLMGCEIGQGYSIARPLPANEIPNWLKHWQPDPRWKNTLPIGKKALPLLYAEAEHRAILRKLSALVTAKQSIFDRAEILDCSFDAYLDEAKKRDKDSSLLYEISIAHDEIHILFDKILSLSKVGKWHQASSLLKRTETSAKHFYYMLDSQIKVLENNP